MSNKANGSKPKSKQRRLVRLSDVVASSPEPVANEPKEQKQEKEGKESKEGREETDKSKDKDTDKDTKEKTDKKRSDKDEKVDAVGDPPAFDAGSEEDQIKYDEALARELHRVEQASIKLNEQRAKAQAEVAKRLFERRRGPAQSNGEPLTPAGFLPLVLIAEVRPADLHLFLSNKEIKVYGFRPMLGGSFAVAYVEIKDQKKFLTSTSAPVSSSSPRLAVSQLTAESRALGIDAEIAKKDYPPPSKRNRNLEEDKKEREERKQKRIEQHDAQLQKLGLSPRPKAAPPNAPRLSPRILPAWLMQRPPTAPPTLGAGASTPQPAAATSSSITTNTTPPRSSVGGGSGAGAGDALAPARGQKRSRPPSPERKPILVDMDTDDSDLQESSRPEGVPSLQSLCVRFFLVLILSLTTDRLWQKQLSRYERIERGQPMFVLLDATLDVSGARSTLTIGLGEA